MIIVLGWKYYG